MRRSFLVGVLVVVIVLVGAAMVILWQWQHPAAGRIRSMSTRLAKSREQTRDARSAAASGAVGMVIAGWGGTQEDSQKIEAYLAQREQVGGELRKALDGMRNLADDPHSKDSRISQALTAYRTQRDQAKQQLAAVEADLIRELNLEGRPKLAAGLTSMGMLDNGLNGMVLRMPRGAGASGAMGWGGGGGAGPRGPRK
jgi:hypothetical protein